jgi:hypothetical protein
MKSLQTQYNLIKEGKGNKEVFVKNAKAQFPTIPNHYGFNETVNELKHKNILNETMLGIVSAQPTTPDWFKIFNESITEAKAEEKKPTKEVVDMETRGFDYKDKKNIDNVYGEEFLKGFYTEMNDPKNEDKTVEELKGIVAKNLAKDQLHYVKDGQFGTKGVGYTTEHPGLGTPKEAKGKYKSSGYGDLKENQSTRSVGSMVKPEGFQVGDKVKYKGMNHEITRIVDDRIYIKNLKYGGRPDTWVKAVDLKKSLKENQLSDIVNQLMNAPKGSKATGGGYGPFIKISSNSWKNTKSNSLQHSRALADFIGRFRDFRISSSTNESKLRSAIHQFIKEELNRESLNEYNTSDYIEAAEYAQKISAKEGVVQHVNELPDGSYEVSDWYDSDSTVISFEDGREL